VKREPGVKKKGEKNEDVNAFQLKKPLQGKFAGEEITRRTNIELWGGVSQCKLH